MNVCSQVKHLLSLPQPEQRTHEWYEVRKGRITASEAASVLVNEEDNVKFWAKQFKILNATDMKCSNPYDSYKKFLLKKVGRGSPFKGNPATDWGTRYEPVAESLYEYISDKPLLKLGFLPHPTIPFLGASPDGVTPDGTMVEIKCPYRRELKGVPPFNYYVQMQLQMEVCDLNVCHYLECKFSEYDDEEAFTECEEDVLRGIHVLLENGRYAYPKAIYETKEESLHWLRKQESVVRVHFWKLNRYDVIEIRRHRKWFEYALPKFEKAFEEIQFHKKTQGENLVMTVDTAEVVSTKKKDKCLF